VKNSALFVPNESVRRNSQGCRSGRNYDVVMQVVLNGLLYMGLVNVVERLVPAIRGDRREIPALMGRSDNL
jgi:hypothetical protein